MDLVTYGSILGRDYHPPELTATYRNRVLSLEDTREEIVETCKWYMADFDRETHQSAPPTQVAELLKSIAETAGALERQLYFNRKDGSSDAALEATESMLSRALSQMYPNEFSSHTSIGDLQLSAIYIYAAANKAQKELEEYSKKGPRKMEARKCFIWKMAQIWEEQTGIKPSASYSDTKEKIEGPFVRFMIKLVDEMPEDIRRPTLRGLGDDARRYLRSSARKA